MRRIIKLTILNKEGGESSPFMFEKENISCGSSSASDICLSDSSVSMHHCNFVMTEPGEYIVIDRESANGIKINGEYIQKSALKHGDVLTIGKIELKYTNEVFFDEAQECAEKKEDKSGSENEDEVMHITFSNKNGNYRLSTLIFYAILVLLGVIALFLFIWIILLHF